MKTIYYAVHTDGRILAVADSFTECSRLVDETGVWDKAPGSVAPYAIQNFSPSVGIYPAATWAGLNADSLAQCADARDRLYFALKDAIRDILALHAQVHGLRAELAAAKSRGFAQGIDNVVSFPKKHGD